MRAALIALLLAAGLAGAAAAAEYEGYDCPVLPPASGTSQPLPPPTAGA